MNSKLKELAQKATPVWSRMEEDEWREAANPAAVLDLITRLEKAEADNAALRKSYKSPCGKQRHLSNNAGRTGDRKGVTLFCATCEEIRAAERETWERALEIVRNSKIAQGIQHHPVIGKNLIEFHDGVVDKIASAIRAAMEE